MTETREEAVLSKDARVIEEVVVGKETTERMETIRDTLRRTDVQVEETGEKNLPNTRKKVISFASGNGVLPHGEEEAHRPESLPGRG